MRGSALERVPVFEELLLEFALALLGLGEFLLPAFEELLFLFEALLDAEAQLKLVLRLFVADFVGLRTFEVVAHVLRGAELAPHFDLLLHFLALVLDPH